MTSKRGPQGPGAISIPPLADEREPGAIEHIFAGGLAGQDAMGRASSKGTEPSGAFLSGPVGH